METDLFLKKIQVHLGKRISQITEITLGNTSTNRYRLLSDNNSYFAKELKDNERDVLKAISHLGLRHLEEIAYPDLLEDNILITPFIDVGHIKNMDISPGLIGDLAKIQNFYFKKAFQKEPTDAERSGWGNFLEGHHTRSRKKLDELKDAYPDVISGYKDIFDALESFFDPVKASYMQMPFRHLHNDFREENILASSPQKIVDWGSSYGFGPMLCDIAPFILHNPQLLDYYRKGIIGIDFLWVSVYHICHTVYLNRGRHEQGYR